VDVYKFLLTLHVLAAVLLIGPFVLVAFMGDRAIRRHDAEDTLRAARYMARFAIGSVVVAVLGAAALSQSDRYDFGSPWVTISLTLWVIAMGVATGYTVPAMRRAARLIEQGVLSGPAPVAALDAADGPGEGPPPNVAATAAELSTKEHLDNIAGRVTGSAALVLVIIVVITVFMVVRPFGR
jgi:uncharacterized membrane protein